MEDDVTLNRLTDKMRWEDVLCFLMVIWVHDVKLDAGSADQSNSHAKPDERQQNQKEMSTSCLENLQHKGTEDNCRIMSYTDIFFERIFCNKHCRWQNVTPKNSKSVIQWTFSNASLLEQFPVDRITKNYVRGVSKILFSKVNPQPFSKSSISLVAISSKVLEYILDLDPNDALQSELFLKFVAGSTLLPNSIPFAHRYGGHQVNKLTFSF